MSKIQLKAVPGSFQAFMKRNLDPAFIKFAQKIYRRDRFACQFCKFRSQKYQEIVNLDHNYQNNKMSNLVVACVFCTQCFFMESIGQANQGGGILIYLPEISQEKLNSLCHVLFCAITNDTGYKTTAQSMYRNFKFRSQIIETEFGEGVSNPAVLGQLLIDHRVSGHKIQNMLQPVRILPSRSKFSDKIEHWAKFSLSEMIA